MCFRLGVRSRYLNNEYRYFIYKLTVTGSEKAIFVEEGNAGKERALLFFLDVRNLQWLLQHGFSSAFTDFRVTEVISLQCARESFFLKPCLKFLIVPKLCKTRLAHCPWILLINCSVTDGDPLQLQLLTEQRNPCTEGLLS